MSTAIGLDVVDQLTGGRLGQFDVPCPLCGPQRREPARQRRKVLRIWRLEPSFAGFHCARCGERGHARDRSAPPPDPARLARAQAEAAAHRRATAADRLRLAQWLWSQRQPLAGSPAERYLREARGYDGPLPGTLGFLPPRGEHAPAMIAAFGLPAELEPGVITIGTEDIGGVHITRLAPDGVGKAGTGTDKIIIGHCLGSPIVVAPPNDLLGLAVTEGIENALTAHAATGLGAWAAGAASRLPALADAVPAFVEHLTIIADDDPDGRRHAAELQRFARSRSISTSVVTLTGRKVAA